MNKFLHLWRAGLQAHLHVESQNGQAYVSRLAAARHAASDQAAVTEEVIVAEEGTATEENILESVEPSPESIAENAVSPKEVVEPSQIPGIRS